MPFNAPENIIHMYGKQKIGLFGVLLQFGPTNKSIEILDPYEVAAVQVQSLKAQGATFIIALSHMAAADNCELAKVRGIDLIVSGHDHQVKMSKDCGDAAYVTASQDWQDIWHIRVNFNFTKPVFQYNSIPITADLPTDPDMDAMINSYEDQIKKEYSVVIARTTVELEGRASEMRSRETNLGNFICDEMRTFGNTTISYFNGGSIRCNKIYPANSDLTKGSIVDMMPFSNKYTVVTLNGTILMQMLEHGVSKVDENSGRFPIFSGLRVVYNLDKPVGSRIISVQFQTPNGYANLQANSTMTVMTSTFLTFGGDDYSMMVGLPFVVTPEEGVDLQMILMQRVTGKTISPTLDGRMTLQK
jgi:2',3'-cyclic-nucleotide 2'-phosphodiesterase (5'-nucleotidase family)